VGHGLIERLEIFEGGLVAFLGGRAQVLVEPPVRRSPRLGLHLPYALAEVLPQQRVRVEGNERARALCPVHSEQLRVFQTLEREVALRFADVDERLG
jgi:hypothetical protein